MFVNQAEGQTLKSRVVAGPATQAALDFTGVTAFAARTDLSGFSSRGPSVGSTLKPDLVAVGEEIVTGAQKSDPAGESYSATGFIDTGGTSFSAPLAAGAAAVLKSARPGLTVPQYRSLLVNGASPATAGEGVAATLSQAGAGMLDLAAAVRGTVAASPTALNFGAADTLHTTVQLSLSNLGAVTDTYTIQAVPTGNDPAPSPGSNTLSLDPGAARQVALTLDAEGLAPGEYSGYLQSLGRTAPPSHAFRIGSPCAARSRQGSRFSIRTIGNTPALPPPGRWYSAWWMRRAYRSRRAPPAVVGTGAGTVRSLYEPAISPAPTPWTSAPARPHGVELHHRRRDRDRHDPGV